MMTSEVTEWIAKSLADGTALTELLIVADWIEERGGGERAAMVRERLEKYQKQEKGTSPPLPASIKVAILRELGTTLPELWSSLMMALAEPRAPSGGIQIGETHYEGGQFIPANAFRHVSAGRLYSDILEKMCPEFPFIPISCSDRRVHDHISLIDQFHERLAHVRISQVHSLELQPWAESARTSPQWVHGRANVRFGQVDLGEVNFGSGPVHTLYDGLRAPGYRVGFCRQCSAIYWGFTKECADAYAAGLAEQAAQEAAAIAMGVRA